MPDLSGVFVAGACSGITSDALTHPISTIKARLYTTNLPPGTPAPSTLAVFREVAMKEGVSKLYTGFSVTVLSAPGRAFYFGGYEVSKRAIATLAPSAKDHPLSHFLSGVAAQGSGSLVWVPMDVMKERLQVQTNSTARPYTGAFNCGRRVIMEEGVGNLYRGFWLHQALWGPFNAVFWPLFEYSKSLLPARLQNGEQGLAGTAICSLGSAALAGFVTNPMDLAKVRLQTNPQYRNTLDCVSGLVQTEGFTALWRGAGARVAWIAPNMMLTMTLFDLFSSMFI